MDPSVLLMLSDLLHLQNHLDPTTSDSTFSASLSSSASPLLFFTIASVLSFASSSLRRCPPSHPPPPHHNNNNNNDDEDNNKNNNANNNNNNNRNNAHSTATSRSRSRHPNAKRKGPTDHSVSAFRSLSSRIWSMEPLARNAQWRSSYGLSYPVFASLLEQLSPLLLHSPLLSYSRLPPDYCLALVLSRLSHGHPRSLLARRHALPPPLVSKLTNLVTRLLSTKLYSDFVIIPSGHRILQLTNAFKDLTSLPNLAGAIASSPVPLSSSLHSALLLQAVSDHRHLFWDLCVKAPASSDPASHFRDSLLYHRLSSNLILRSDSSVTVRDHHVRPYIAGDGSYPLLPFLLTPFSPNSTGTPAQNVFDAALFRARSSVDHALALLKGRWRILQNLNVGLSHAPQTIVACCVLHNICQIAGEPEPDLCKDFVENRPAARVLESEKPLFYYGQSLRQVLADDLYERQQRLMSR